jgi:hypothetical protein
VTDNPYAIPFICNDCRDVRYVTDHSAARLKNVKPCRRCGPDSELVDGKNRETASSAERYEHFRATRMAEIHGVPELTQDMLTPKEWERYLILKVEHPHTSNRTLLSWLEGQRYDPSKDPDFLQDARQKFRDWKHRVTS